MELFPSMDRSHFLAELKRRNIHALAVAYVTAGLLLIELAAILLAILEAADWGMGGLVRAMAPGNAHAPVRRLDRSTRYKSRAAFARSAPMRKALEHLGQ